MNSRIFSSLLIALLVCGGIIWYTRRTPTIPQPITTLRVGISSDFPPFAYKEQGNLVGFDIDLLRELGQRLNKEIEFVDMPFITLMPQLQTGSIHLIASGISRTNERASCALFTIPYITGDTLVVLSSEQKPALNGVEDLYGKTVAVNEGYTADTYLSKLPSINALRLPTLVDAFIALESGRAEALITQATSLKQLHEMNRLGAYRIFTIPEMCEEIALAVSKHYPELNEQLSALLDSMKKDGSLDRLKTTWGLI